jgi:hypothetical protein
MTDAIPLKILALDGGGVRGLSEVLILKNLFQRIDYEDNAGQRSAHLPEPWKYFDLICGTSTGGLLALMLGRLRMVHTSPCPRFGTLSHVVNLVSGSLRRGVFEAFQGNIPKTTVRSMSI